MNSLSNKCYSFTSSATNSLLYSFSIITLKTLIEFYFVYSNILTQKLLIFLKNWLRLTFKIYFENKFYYQVILKHSKLMRIKKKSLVKTVGLNPKYCFVCLLLCIYFSIIQLTFKAPRYGQFNFSPNPFQSFLWFRIPVSMLHVETITLTQTGFFPSP